MALYALGDRVPSVAADAFVHPDAVVIGAVTIGSGSTVWPSAVLRADYGEIVIGENTSVQDGSVIHSTDDQPTLIGSRCVIGHLVHMEACTIEDDSLVGSGSVVLPRSRVGPGSLVAAGAVVREGTVVPPGAMATGVPATIRENAVREGTIGWAVDRYVENGKRYRETLRRLD